MQCKRKYEVRTELFHHHQVRQLYLNDDMLSLLWPPELTLIAVFMGGGQREPLAIVFFHVLVVSFGEPVCLFFVLSTYAFFMLTGVCLSYKSTISSRLVVIFTDLTCAKLVRTSVAWGGALCT